MATSLGTAVLFLCGGRTSGARWGKRWLMRIPHCTARGGRSVLSVPRPPGSLQVCPRALGHTGRATPGNPNSACEGAVPRLQGLGSEHGGLQPRENLFGGPQSSGLSATATWRQDVCGSRPGLLPRGLQGPSPPSVRSPFCGPAGSQHRWALGKGSHQDESCPSPSSNEGCLSGMVFTSGATKVRRTQTLAQQA